MLDTSMYVKAEKFDGPLALLLHLIQKEEMNIRELDLTVITREYLAYLVKMQELNFNIVGDYLYLSATLLLLKSKSCITEDESQKLCDEMGESPVVITSQAELIRRLEELEKFQGLGQKLWQLPKKGHEIFVKPKVNRKEIANSILTPIDLEKLTTTMMDIIMRGKRKCDVIKRDRISIKQKLMHLRENLSKNNTYQFSELIENYGDEGMDDIIITFISVLELARLQKVSVYQNENGSDIYVKVLDSLENFDVTLANGFDDENQDENGTTDEDIPSDEIIHTQSDINQQERHDGNEQYSQ